jgi:3-oxoacyl-[acyl-carrier protein] reductase
VYSVNVIEAYQMTRAVVPTMKKQGNGAVVNISSNVVFTGGGSPLAYTASKGALNALTLGLARILGPEIRVTAVSPGTINTWWMRNALGEDAYDALEAKFCETAPMRRVAEVDDVAEAVVWLLHGTRYVAGEIIGVDGGIRLSGGREA